MRKLPARHAQARRGRIHTADFVTVSEGCAAGGTDDRISHIDFDIIIYDRLSRLFLAFHGPFLDRAVYAMEVSDTTGHSGPLPGQLVVRNRDRSQQSYDGHYNHDFHQGEPSSVELFVLH